MWVSQLLEQMEHKNALADADEFITKIEEILD